jgi:hypothetical protein
VSERFCDENCNNCFIVRNKNSRAVNFILECLFERFGNEVYKIVQSICPNLTCCYDCRIDDFCHVEGCKIREAAENFKV